MSLSWAIWGCNWALYQLSELFHNIFSFQNKEILIQQHNQLQTKVGWNKSKQVHVHIVPVKRVHQAQIILINIFSILDLHLYGVFLVYLVRCTNQSTLQHLSLQIFTSTFVQDKALPNECASWYFCAQALTHVPKAASKAINTHMNGVSSGAIRIDNSWIEQFKLVFELQCFFMESRRRRMCRKRFTMSR